jgi:hypothetical protein
MMEEDGGTSCETKTNLMFIVFKNLMNNEFFEQLTIVYLHHHHYHYHTMQLAICNVVLVVVGD